MSNICKVVCYNFYGTLKIPIHFYAFFMNGPQVNIEILDTYHSYIDNYISFHNKKTVRIWSLPWTHEFSWSEQPWLLVLLSVFLENALFYLFSIQ